MFRFVTASRNSLVRLGLAQQSFCTRVWSRKREAKARLEIPPLQPAIAIAAVSKTSVEANFRLLLREEGRRTWPAKIWSED